MARDLVRQDDVVDDLNRECFRLALEIGDDADKREWAMTMLLAARAIERIADNAVDIGEQVAFVVTGLFREFEDASHPTPSCAPGSRAAGSDPIGLGTWRQVPRDALRSDRYRFQHHPRARRRADRGAVEEGDGAARLHADQQGDRGRRRRSSAEKIEEVCEVVATQVRLARELGAETIRAVATAAVREATQRRAGRGRRSPTRPASRSRSSARRRRADSPSSARPRPSATRSTARSASSTSAAARPR